MDFINFLPLPWRLTAFVKAFVDRIDKDIIDQFITHAKDRRTIVSSMG